MNLPPFFSQDVEVLSPRKIKEKPGATPGNADREAMIRCLLFDHSIIIERASGARGYFYKGVVQEGIKALREKRKRLRRALIRAGR